MRTIGPRDPATETLEEYVQRIVRTAPRPTPEMIAEFAALLGFTTGSGRFTSESRPDAPAEGGDDDAA